MSWAVNIEGDTAHFVGNRDRFRFSAPVRNCRMNARVRTPLIYEICLPNTTTTVSIQFRGSRAKGRLEGSCIDPVTGKNSYIEGEFRARR